jgi:ubiquinone biosynthesis monooxygenase Coq7
LTRPGTARGIGFSWKNNHAITILHTVDADASKIRLAGKRIDKMTEPIQQPQQKNQYDVSIIRPQLRNEDIKIRGRGFPEPRLKSLKKGLRTLHTLELMAVNIYKFQVIRTPGELNRQLIAAMCNEMTHFQDFQLKLLEYGFRPSILRWAYWLVGFAFGLGSRLLGRKAILKTGIWVESKAVHHYSELLHSIDWDEDSRRTIEKNQADEYGHISRWKNLLHSLQQDRD